MTTSSINSPRSVLVLILAGLVLLPSAPLISRSEQKIQHCCNLMSANKSHTAYETYGIATRRTEERLGMTTEIFLRNRPRV
ncbi:hypothetical protein BDQ17DRAFT_1372103 [Cyathus striatus]|nr:hypothetical protein BDQ17DRAFT_1372103 [Cyathus striatus]